MTEPLVTAVFEMADPGGGEDLARHIAVLDDFVMWSAEDHLATWETSPSLRARGPGGGVLMRFQATEEGIERIRGHLGEAVLVANDVCDVCLSAPSYRSVSDVNEGVERHVALCERCIGDGLDERLSASERTLASAVADEWTSIALSAQPADRLSAEAGVRAVYTSAGLAAPTAIVWCASPLAAAVVAATIGAIRPERFNLAPPTKPRYRPVPVGDPALVELGRRIGRSLHTELRNAAVASVDAEFPPLVRRAARASVWTPVMAAGDRLSGRVSAEVRERISGAVVGHPAPEGPAPDAAALFAASWAGFLAQLEDHTDWVRSADHAWSRVFAECWHHTEHDRWRIIAREADKHFPAPWMALCDFYVRVGRLPGWPEALVGDRHAAQACGPWRAFEHVALMTDGPTRVTLDAHGDLHRDDGPAVEYADGFAVYAWHGVRVARRVILEPETITTHDIEAETDAKVRRTLAERFGGWARYLQACGAQVQHRDDFGTLWRRESANGEPLVMVEVQGAPPDPDGIPNHDVLPVPPEVRTARQAVAWTFGFDADAYAPKVVPRTDVD